MRDIGVSIFCYYITPFPFVRFLVKTSTDKTLQFINTMLLYNYMDMKNLRNIILTMLLIL